MKHYIFDLNGVLCESVNRADIQDEIIVPKKNCEQDYMKYYLEVEKGNIDYDTFIVRVNSYLKYPDLNVNDYKSNYLALKDKYCLINQEIINLIYKLKSEGHKIYLLSNLIPMDIEWLKKNIDISIFDRLFLSCEMHMLKPDIEIFKSVINTIQDDVSNIYYYDDKELNISRASSLGINGILYKKG